MSSPGFCHNRRLVFFRAAAVCALGALVACAATVKQTQPPPPPLPPPPLVVVVPTSPPPAPDQIYRETGTAGWYGREFQGRKTASGEAFDRFGISAAHRTLPLGTVVRVTNLENYRSIKVKINDRGPFVKSRFLDLSYGAARELGYVEQGTALVKIETMEAIRGTGRYTVQAASYTEEENARMLKERLSQKFELVYIDPIETNVARFFRVRIGSYSSEERAEQVAEKLMLEGLEPLVLRKD